MSMDGSPWLSIPLADYEGHMDAIGQSGALRRLFAEVYAAVKPERLAVLGCTTGADFGDVDPAVTQLALGVDINARYIAAAERRAIKLGLNAQFICDDALCVDLSHAPFDLVHAALLIEYLDPAALFRQVRRWLCGGGVFSVVSQEPSVGVDAVSATKFDSLQLLAGHMTLRPAVEIERIGIQEGFALKSRRSLEVSRGKMFMHSRFEVEGAAPPDLLQTTQ